MVNAALIMTTDDLLPPYTTWNVLFDKYELNHCRTTRRRPQVEATGHGPPRQQRPPLSTSRSRSERNDNFETGMEFVIWLVFDPAFFSSGQTTPFLKSDENQPTASD